MLKAGATCKVAKDVPCVVFHASENISPSVSLNSRGVGKERRLFHNLRANFCEAVFAEQTAERAIVPEREATVVAETKLARGGHVQSVRRRDQ